MTTVVGRRPEDTRLPPATHHFCEADFLEDGARRSPTAWRASLSHRLFCKKDTTSHRDGPAELLQAALQRAGVSQPPEDAAGWHQPPPLEDFQPKFPSGSSQHLKERSLHCMCGQQQGNDMVST